MGEILKKILTNSGFQILVASIGLLITLVNVFIASTLAPISTRIDSLAVQVEALDAKQELDDETLKDLIPDVKVIQEQVKNIRTDINEIKQGQIRMENKLDNLLLQ